MRRPPLVLDDYHLIREQKVHQAVEALLPALLLVITTREDPLLPLSRLRARGRLVELRAKDLRFTTAEAAAFLNQTMNLGLTPSEVSPRSRGRKGRRCDRERRHCIRRAEPTGRHLRLEPRTIPISCSPSSPTACS
ncbi:MAG: hypothetical protein ACM3RP_01960 [Chitinophagales bacterium]